MEKLVSIQPLIPMKRLILLALIASVVVSRAELAFEGYIVTSGRPLFAFSSEKDRKSGWITFGQTFDGFTIVRFEPKTDVLILEKEGQQHRVTMRAAKILATPPEDANARLRSLKGMALAYELAKGGDSLITRMLHRYHESIIGHQKEPSVHSQSARDFLKAQIEEAAQMRARK